MRFSFFLGLHAHAVVVQHPEQMLVTMDQHRIFDNSANISETSRHLLTSRSSFIEQDLNHKPSSEIMQSCWDHTQDCLSFPLPFARVCCRYCWFDPLTVNCDSACTGDFGNEVWQDSSHWSVPEGGCTSGGDGGNFQTEDRCCINTDHQVRLYDEIEALYGLETIRVKYRWFFSPNDCQRAATDPDNHDMCDLDRYPVVLFGPGSLSQSQLRAALTGQVVSERLSASNHGWCWCGLTRKSCFSAACSSCGSNPQAGSPAEHVNDNGRAVTHMWKHQCR